MSDTEELKRVLRSAHLQIRKQDGKFLLYNREKNLLSRGLLLPDLGSVKAMAVQYLTYLRSVGPISLVDFASDHQTRPVPHKEVQNLVDTDSAYYINRSASATKLGRANLLVAAKVLENRALIAETSEGVSEKLLRRHRKLKMAAHHQFKRST